MTKLQDKLRDFEQLVSLVEDYAIFTMDASGIILDWNLGAERIKGYTADQIVGRHFSAFYSEEDRASELPGRELVIATAEGKFVDEGWRFRQDGTRLWASVTITAIKSADQEVVGFLKITRDLTQRMEAAELLRQSEERFRLLLESVQDYAIFMLDPEGHIVSWNNGARRIKGYEAAEIIGRHFSVFYPVESLELQIPRELMGRALREGRAEDEGWRVRKDGTLFWGNVIITALRDDRGELRGFAKITRDLTPQKKIENLEAAGHHKDVFLATLAHELRNPLAPMLPALEVILKSAAKPEVVRSVASTLQRQVDQMAHLIDDLLDVSRINTGKIVLKKEPVLLADVVERAVESVMPAIEEARHEFRISLPPGDVEIEVDSHRISQIIANLLSNAAKYTPPGGRLDLEVTSAAWPTLEVLVRDNGQGIAPEIQGRIFELFNQGTAGSPDGLGIGLTLVKRLVEMHGGRVSLKSEGEGKGSEFRISLPVLTGQLPERKRREAAESGAGEEPKGDRIRVLVADDSQAAADILAMFFESEGMEAMVAYDGVEAADTAASFQPDLVVMDIGMPRMDGYEAAGHIRRLRPEVLLVALSGWGGEEDRQRSAAAGFDVHLVKPVLPADLRRLLKERFPAKPAE